MKGEWQSLLDPPTLEQLIAAVTPVDEAARADAQRRSDQLAKPPGSLGRLETLGAQLSAIAHRCPPPVPQHPWLLLAAADHGVHPEGVNAWPQHVTAAIVDAACTGRSVSAVLARAAGIQMTVLDVGLAHPTGDHAHLVRRPVRAGTRNLAVEDAMTPGELRAAIAAGADAALGMINNEADLLLLGEVGMTNTTSSACLVAVATGRPAAEVTGTGAGADEATLRRKVQIVEHAVRRCMGRGPLEVLAAVGGYEHAALIGAILAAAAHRVPIVLDGVVTNAAALYAVQLQPRVADYLVASHRSSEAGAAAALTHLQLAPLLDLQLRLGEGSGALLAAHLVLAAAAVLTETATLQDLV